MKRLEILFGATRCLAWHFQRLSDRAPPARRIATQGRSYILDCPQEVGQKIQPLGGPMGKYTEQFKLTAISAYLDGS
ncbi:hypothetical protein, partial [Pseudomonas sp. SWRI68]|uniref:hypothetical protein n=1 Tax=Pseudomonas sp. SWRI68 TaxID=2745486 RepID=UPI001EE1C6FC